MATKKIGKQTVKFQNPPSILSHAAVGGKMEMGSPLAEGFDYLSSDQYFGESTWEEAESAMERKCFDLCLEKIKFSENSLDYIVAGDLLNQCTGSTFALNSVEVPFFGIYGACSTMAEALSFSAMLVDGGYAELVCAITSSHFCTAERQFRTPLAYGGVRTPSAQWTATASGSIILGTQNSKVKITMVTTGKMVNGGICDVSHMGGAMAPAALETLCTHFSDTGRNPEYYDVIATGDLGKIGHEILLDLAFDKGFDLKKNCCDCGMLIYDPNTQDVKAGGSGCGCSASVLAGHFLPRLESGEIKSMLFAATGALMSPTSAQQGKPIVGICHAVAIERI